MIASPAALQVVDMSPIKVILDLGVLRLWVPEQE